MDEDKFITDRKIIKIGKLNVLHGHEVGGGVFSPVNFARTLFMKMGESTIAGDRHQTSEHSFTRPASDEIITCWSTGHLAEAHPKYRPINNWNHGFAVVEQDGTGMFEVHNKRIVRNKVM
jgi:hypothetical protein